MVAALNVYPQLVVRTYGALSLRCCERLHIARPAHHKASHGQKPGSAVVPVVLRLQLLQGGREELLPLPLLLIIRLLRISYF